jgi:glycerophosphoryl diester phosphodiesterase
VVFSSFEAAALERLRRRSQTAALAVLWEDARVAGAVHQSERVGARALHLRKDAATPDALAAATAAGLPVRVWTVNEPSDFARLRGQGADGIFTDYPERFLQSAGGA